MKKILSILFVLALVLSFSLVATTPVAAATPVASGLVLHLDADAITGLNDDDLVSQWDDLSGQDNHAAQATAANQPAYKTGVLDGKPVVRFDGINDWMVMPDSDDYLELNNRDLTAFVVLIRADATHAANYGIIGQYSGTFPPVPNQAWHLFDSATAIGSFIRRDSNAETVFPTGTTKISDGVARVYMFQKDGLEVSGWVGGVEEASGVLSQEGNTKNAYPLSIARHADNYMAADFAEILIYNRALTTQERVDVEWYLGEKWLGWDRPDEVWVCTTGDDADPGTETEPFASIQHGIHVVAEGGTVHVKAGEYQEQLLIEKGLTLRPATVNGDFVAVTIKAPDYAARTRIVKAGWPQQCYDYIIRVTASDVTIEGFTVEGHDGMYNGTQHRHCDGVWRGSADGDVSRDPRRVGFFGIWYDGEDEGGITGGQVRNNTIADVVAWTASAIMVSDAAEVAVEENVMPIHVWGNVGIIAEGTGTVVTAYGNEMSGTIGTSHWSQGGIQFGGAAGSGGATGSATHNTVENLRSGTGAMSTGIGVYEGADVDLIEHNTLDNTDCAIILWGWSEDTKVSEIKDNTLTNSRYYGIAVYEGSEVGLIEGNTVEGNAWGILTYPWGGRAAQINVIECNAIEDNTSGGIRFICPDTVLPVVRYNSIAGSPWGLHNACGEDVDATFNWWGDASGPSHADNPGGTGAAVSDNVDFAPWLTTGLEDSLSVDTATGTGPALFVLSEGNVASLEAIEAVSPGPRGVTFPHGMFELDICCLTPGQTVEVTVTLPAAVPVGTVWWKYHDGEWYSLPNLDDNGNATMRFRLTDGGLGDSDGDPDGFIRDPGGPGNPMTPLAVGWEGSPVNRVAVVAPWIAMLATMMAGATLVVVRRRRAQI